MSAPIVISAAAPVAGSRRRARAAARCRVVAQLFMIPLSSPPGTPGGASLPPAGCPSFVRGVVVFAQGPALVTGALATVPAVGPLVVTSTMAVQPEPQPHAAAARTADVGRQLNLVSGALAVVCQRRAGRRQRSADGQCHGSSAESNPRSS